MADGLCLFSNGYGLYEALSAAPYNLCKPQPQTQTQTQTHDNIEYRPELKIVPCDQSCATATRFFSPGGESCTPPGTPASTAASAPSPSTPTSSTSTSSTPTVMTTTTHPGFESGFDESAESEGYPARVLYPPPPYCRLRTLDSSWRPTSGAPPGSRRTSQSPPWATSACPPMRSCSRVRASLCTAALWIRGRTGRAGRCITVVRVGLRVTGCIGWLAINARSAVIDPLRALIMAGMYTVTLPPTPRWGSLAGC